MKSCFFILSRYWLRLDGVVFRLFDTRIYHEFGTDFVLREVQFKESSYQSISQVFNVKETSYFCFEHFFFKKKMLPPDPAKYNDPNVIGPLMKVTEAYTEELKM
jgi:hypothetical protein